MSPTTVEEIGKVVLKFGSTCFGIGKKYTNPPKEMQKEYADSMLEIINIIYKQHSQEYAKAVMTIKR